MEPVTLIAAAVALGASDGVRGHGDVRVRLDLPRSSRGFLDAMQRLHEVGGRWAVVDELSYESKGIAGIHVVGDAISSAQPKAGHQAENNNPLANNTKLPATNHGSNDNNN